MKRLFTTLLAAAAIMLASAAQAAPISHFVFDGVTGPDLVFDIPTNPMPDDTFGAGSKFLMSLSW